MRPLGQSPIASSHKPVLDLCKNKKKQFIDWRLNGPDRQHAVLLWLFDGGGGSLKDCGLCNLQYKLNEFDSLLLLLIFTIMYALTISKNITSFPSDSFGYQSIFSFFFLFCFYQQRTGLCDNG